MNVGHDQHSSNPYHLGEFIPLPAEILNGGLCTFDVWPATLWDLSVAGEHRIQRDKRRAAAISICQICPVQALCEDFAREAGEVGVWGGKVFRLC